MKFTWLEENNLGGLYQTKKISENRFTYPGRIRGTPATLTKYYFPLVFGILMQINNSPSSTGKILDKTRGTGLEQSVYIVVLAPHDGEHWASAKPSWIILETDRLPQCLCMLPLRSCVDPHMYVGGVWDCSTLIAFNGVFSMSCVHTGQWENRYHCNDLSQSLARGRIFVLRFRGTGTTR